MVPDHIRDAAQMVDQIDTKFVAVHGTTVEKWVAEATVNKAIVEGCVPELYYLIDTLLKYEGMQFPKELKVQARKALPAWCDNSFQNGAEKAQKDKA